MEQAITEVPCVLGLYEADPAQRVTTLDIGSFIDDLDRDLSETGVTVEGGSVR